MPPFHSYARYARLYIMIITSDSWQSEMLLKSRVDPHVILLMFPDSIDLAWSDSL